MKRNEDTPGGIIKIPDVSAVASVAQQQLQQSVFVQRPQQGQPTHIELTSRPVNVTSTAAQITLPRGVVSMSPAAGVTVYRSDSNPPAAHSGGVAISTTPSGLSSQPPVAHHTQSTIVGQQTPLKPEQITLPNTPVSLPYGTAVTTTYSGVAPASIKTLTGGMANNSVGHSQIIHQKQPAAHQNFPIRTMSSLGTAAAALTNAMPGSGLGPNLAGNANFQRLKVEDALSYLDQVKYKFGNQPQVYNDFLDIMKEFKSQSIDTPGVIARVSCLFKGHPELIVGFNTFLPPGYKIEVQCNDAIAVSMPGILGAGMQTIVHTPHGIQTMAPAGHLTSITTAQAASLAASTTVRPVTIQTGNSTQKFQTTVIKSDYPGGGLRLGSEVSLVPQMANQQHLLTTANLQPQQPQQPQTPQQPQNNQPVEFNHAINYVNKIKNRFAGQPDVYKQFLEILHTYQKDQRAIKEGHAPTGRYLTESEVFAQVAKLFQNQEDLLNEFSQFLPEATNDSLMPKAASEAVKRPSIVSSSQALVQPRYAPTQAAARYPPAMGSVTAKRPPTGLSHPPPKKPKYGVLRDVSLAEAGKYGSLNEYAFFDKVRKALKSKEAYDDFLRVLVLFNQEVISRTELVQLAVPFLSKYPELFKWFKDFLGYKEAMALPVTEGATKSEPMTPQVPQRFSGDSAMDIDYATCKRLGASYCALPKNFVQPTCTGRTGLCREVLNDTWVSFPSWSEDSQFVTSRKTQYEEFIYRTEDERFEFDVVLETNKDTIKVLEVVQKKMSRMPPEEAARYRLDDTLGGSSPTIHQRAIRRIYGDKANDIIDGLKRNPVVAVPLVLRRLKSKDEEWREVQKNFNKTWRDQNEKYYLKSLDHQSLLFKQSDTRFLRSKSLLNELETLYDERHEQEEANANATTASEAVPVPEGPHMTLDYSDMQILDDVNNLLIHHVKRQTSIHKEDKHKIKVLLKHFLMDLFKHPRQEMSEDEREDEEDSEKDEDQDPEGSNGSKSTRAARKKKETDNKKEAKKDDKKELINEADIKVEPSKDGRRTPLHARDMEPDESYSHIMANNNWCLFLRLHNILSERLTKMYNQAVIIANEETKDRKERKESIAVALRLKPKNEIEPEDYYPAFLDMVKNLLDGNMDAQAYEDTLGEMFGIHAYVSFTLDKVVSNAVRQLQHLVMDESCVDCYDLYLSEKKNGATGGFCSSASDRQLAELVYQKRSEKMLADENCFKIFIYHQSGKMSIELLDTETEGQNSDQDEESARKYSSYVDRFIQPGDEISDECKVQLTRKPVFLPRSIRSYNQSPYGKMREMQQQQQQNHVKKPDQDANGVSKESSPSAKKELFNDKDVVFEDNLQCKFNPRNFKILYVINSENCFYRRLALTRAKNSHKSVSQRKCKDFGRWHSKWMKANVPDSSSKSIDEWFMGKSEGLVMNKTHKITKADMDRTPYRTFHKYKAEIINTSNSNGPVPAPTATMPPTEVATPPAAAGGNATA